MKILTIPDCHVKKGFNRRIFTALGELIVATKPDHVVDLGDFGDIPSLNSHEVFSNSLYQDDISSVIEAKDLIMAPIKRQKKTRPKFWQLLGNHEFRISRRLQELPVLKGTIGIGDLQYAENGWEVVGYKGKEPGILELEGISFAHFFSNTNAPSAISGRYHASTLIQRLHSSSTCGHSHLLNYHTEVDSQGYRMHGLVGGCLFTDFKDYAGQGNRHYWKGLTMKHDVRHGDYDPEFISLERLLRC